MEKARVLWKKAKNGDKNAFASLFRTYYPMLCSYLVQHTQNFTEAEEISQILFVKIWKKRETMTIHTSFKSYLFRAGFNEFLNRKAKQKAHDKFIEEVKFRSMSNNLDENKEEVEIKMEKLKRSIEQLPEKCRQILILSKWDRLKHKEIAEKLNISTKTVEAQLRIAYIKIRKAFDDENDTILFLLFGNEFN